MNSFNHYAYGAIGEWLYATVAGLDLDPAQPGYKHIVIHPRPGGKLTRARATLHTLYGVAESSWRIAGNKFHLRVTIPPNTTAAVTLPGQRPRKIVAGRYRFTTAWPH
jgi:alpha-L-rhamnosidase